MINRKILISWIVSSIVMFIASYLWHGVFLNDFSRITYPKAIFFIVASVVYLTIGFIIAKAYEIKYESLLQKKPRLKGTLTGAICGLLIYLITMVVGISFSKTMTTEYLLIDLGWQMLEQAIGGFAVGVTHIILIRKSPYWI